MVQALPQPSSSAADVGGHAHVTKPVSMEALLPLLSVRGAATTFAAARAR